jgi:hypothetical protein
MFFVILQDSVLSNVSTGGKESGKNFNNLILQFRHGTVPLRDLFARHLGQAPLEGSRAHVRGLDNPLLPHAGLLHRDVHQGMDAEPCPLRDLAENPREHPTASVFQHDRRPPIAACQHVANRPWRFNARIPEQIGRSRVEQMHCKISFLTLNFPAANHATDPIVQAALQETANRIEEGNKAHRDPAHEAMLKKRGNKAPLPQAGGNNYQPSKGAP